MINVGAWIQAARTTGVVGGCPRHGCKGRLRCPVDTWPDGRTGTVAFHDHTPPDGGESVRFYEARCDGCRAVFAYPAGRDAVDAAARDRDRKGRRGREDAMRVGEFMPGYNREA